MTYSRLVLLGLIAAELILAAANISKLNDVVLLVGFAIVLAILGCWRP